MRISCKKKQLLLLLLLHRQSHLFIRLKEHTSVVSWILQRLKCIWTPINFKFVWFIVNRYWSSLQPKLNVWTSCKKEELIGSSKDHVLLSLKLFKSKHYLNLMQRRKLLLIKIIGKFIRSTKYFLESSIPIELDLALNSLLTILTWRKPTAGDIHFYHHLHSSLRQLKKERLA